MHRRRSFRALVAAAALLGISRFQPLLAEDAGDTRSDQAHARKAVPQSVTVPQLGIDDGLPTGPKTLAEWRKTLGQWRRQIDPAALPKDDPAGEAAKEQIRAIRAPNAFPALESAFRSEKNQDLRLLYLETLGRIESPKTLKLLVDVAVTPPRALERRIAAKLLGELPDRREAIPHFIKYLRVPVYSSNAAEALSVSGLTESQSRSELPDPGLTTALINALVLTDTRLEPVLVYGPDIGVGRGKYHWGYSTYRRFIRVYYPIPNEEALHALTECTGEDYGYDQSSWHEWHERRRADAKESK